MKQVSSTMDPIRRVGDGEGDGHGDDGDTTTPVDPWTGISEDVIRRFFDVLCIERGMPKGMLSAYRADLYAFDRWLIEAKRKTLISATKQDVSEYLTSSTASIKAFYSFLVNSGCRDDDPTKATRKPRKRRQRN